MSGSVLIFDQEKKFSAHRLTEIARARFPEVFGGVDGASHLASLMGSVIVYNEPTSKSLLGTLAGIEETIVTRGVRLLVVDSIAALALNEFGAKDVVARQQTLSEIASALKSIGATFDIPIVVTNQVLARHGDHVTTPGVELEDADGLVVPALGTMWSHAVNTRLALEANGPNRRLRIVKSPTAPAVACPFRITDAGVEVSMTDPSAGWAS